MNSVVTPAACACATIAARLPPLDLLTYQIHMPWPSKAEPLTAPTVRRRAVLRFAAAGAARGGRRRSGPYGARVPRTGSSSTMMRPERAAAPSAISPALVLRRCETGELRAMRAPGVRGKAIDHPGAQAFAGSSSVPRVET